MATQIITPAGSLRRPTISGLRRGRWIVFREEVGIIIEILERSARVMLTDEDGFNKIEVLAATNELRVAKAREIPKKRVEHLDEDELKAMGYL